VPVGCIFGGKGKPPCEHCCEICIQEASTVVSSSSDDGSSPVDLDAKMSVNSPVDVSTEGDGWACGNEPACEAPFETCVNSPSLGAQCCHVTPSDAAGLLVESCRVCEGGSCTTATDEGDAALDSSDSG
jgi:hypothetical protein